MNKELELWQFIAERLGRDESVMLLVVGESTGSSPGRQGHKMAVGADGGLCGSIGGGVMEVNLVERARAALSEPPAATGGLTTELVAQVHRKSVPNASGMICSGMQTVILRWLGPHDIDAVKVVNADLQRGKEPWLVISELEFKTAAEETEPQNSPLPSFERFGDIFSYIDKLGPKDELYVIGGGHCALALSSIMSQLDFKIRIFDDRPGLNTLKKNEFANEIRIVRNYDLIRHHILEGQSTYVVVMTLGYESDAAVIRQLANREFKYFGVLGSKAKMATLMKDLRAEGFDQAKLARIHTPIGLPINSRTPEEIAVSIAAEIIAVKNART